MLEALRQSPGQGYQNTRPADRERSSPAFNVKGNLSRGISPVKSVAHIRRHFSKRRFRVMTVSQSLICRYVIKFNKDHRKPSPGRTEAAALASRRLLYRDMVRVYTNQYRAHRQHR